MKLKNKKTGEIMYLLFNSYPVSGDIVLEYIDENAESGYSEYKRYSTLAELNEEWEDYKLSEPLIENKKMRKVVRLWATANGLTEIRYNKYDDCIHWPYSTDTSVNISFEDVRIFEKLEHMKIYTIDELCGVEE